MNLPSGGSPIFSGLESSTGFSASGGSRRKGKTAQTIIQLFERPGPRAASVTSGKVPTQGGCEMQPSCEPVGEVKRAGGTWPKWACGVPLPYEPRERPHGPINSSFT